MSVIRFRASVFALGVAFLAGCSDPVKPGTDASTLAIGGTWFFSAVGSADEIPCTASGTLQIQQTDERIEGTHSPMGAQCFAGCTGCSNVSSDVDASLEALRELAETLNAGRIVNGSLNGTRLDFALSSTSWQNTGVVETQSDGEELLRGSGTVHTDWRDIDIDWIARRDNRRPVINSIDPDEIPAPAVPGEFVGGTFRLAGGNFQGADVFVDGPLIVLGSPAVRPDGLEVEKSFSIGCCEPLDHWIGRTFNVFVVTPLGVDQVPVRIVAP